MSSCKATNANGYVVHYRDSQLDAMAESFGPFTELRVEDA